MMNGLELIRNIYIWLGIDLLDKSAKNSTRKILSGLKKTYFPLFLHLNVIFIKLLDEREFKMMNLISYCKILDFLMFLLPCSLWWSLYSRRNDIRLLMQFISKIKGHFIQPQRNLKLFIIGAIIYWSIFMISSFVTSNPVARCIFLYYNKNVSFIGSNSSISEYNLCYWRKAIKDIFLHIQELLMPFLFSILYFAVCYNFIKIFKYYLAKITDQHDCCDKEILRLILIEYVKGVKYVERFAIIFTLPLFWFSWHVVCNISLLFLDFLSLKIVTYFSVIYNSFMIISLTGIIATLSFCADEIPVSINEFKRSVYDIKTDRLLKNNLELSDLMDIVLNRETVSITIFRIMHFDRSFLFKMIATIIANAVIYHQLTQI